MKWSLTLFASARVIKGKSRLNLPLKQALIITPEAINRIKELLLNKPGAEALKVILKFKILIFYNFIDWCRTAGM